VPPPSDQTSPPSRDQEDLFREVDTAMKDAKPHLHKDDSDSNQEEDAEEETEEEIIQRAFDQAQLERNQAAPSDIDREDLSHALNDSQIKEPEETEFSFPSLPQHHPSESEHEDEGDAESETMMARLLGLTGPKHIPGQPSLPPPPKTEPGKGWSIPGFNDSRDEDLDSWCCKSPELNIPIDKFSWLISEFRYL
jgi:hypothetical protein